MTSQTDLREIRDSLETTFSMFKTESEVRSYIGHYMSGYWTCNLYTNSRCQDVYSEAMTDLQKDVKEKYGKISRKIKSYIKSLEKRKESASKYDDFGLAGVSGNAILGAGAGAGLALVLGGPVVWAAGAVAIFAGLCGSSQNKQRLISNIMSQAKRINDEAISNLKSVLDPLIPEEVVVKEESPTIPLIEKAEEVCQEDAIAPSEPIKDAIVEEIPESKKTISLSGMAESKKKEDALTPEQIEIKSFLERRGIRYLVHFTGAVSYDSVKEHGILSVAEAKKRNVEITIKDSGRLTTKNVGIYALGKNLQNYISLSITKPCEPLIGKYKKAKKIDKAVIFYIDADILWKEIGHDRVYCALNSKYKHLEPGSDTDAFERLFAPTIVQLKNYDTEEEIYSRKPWQPENETTHPQAEILFEGFIDPKYIKKVEAR